MSSPNYTDTQLLSFREIIEDAILANGAQGKESAIRSSGPINCIHNLVKHELISRGISADNVFPPLDASSPEIKIAGFLKQKDQDITVLPGDIKPQRSSITWGPLAYENKVDPWGHEFVNESLVINVRSQISSVGKNADTLFERTFAEAQNLHMVYPELVLGEVYLVPLHEYDDKAVKEKRIAFKKRPINLKKYISFFSALNGRANSGDHDLYKYEKVALMIVDFQAQPYPRLIESTDELIERGLVPSDFSIELRDISFSAFTDEIIEIYKRRCAFSHLSISRHEYGYIEI